MIGLSVNYLSPKFLKELCRDGLISLLKSAYPQYNCQYALVIMMEKWKLSLDNRGFAGGILVDLSKAFDTINHKLLMATLHAYVFNEDALEIIISEIAGKDQKLTFRLVHGQNYYLDYLRVQY